MLSEQALAEIARERAKYPEDRAQSALLAALRIAQEDRGFLATEVMDHVAHLLGIEPIRAYEVATFYSMYDLQPVGRHKICVCGSVSCFLRGSDQILAHLEERLGIRVGETTPDGLFTLREVECLGACLGAPMMQVGDRYYENLTKDRVDGILAALREGGDDVG